MKKKLTQRLSAEAKASARRLSMRGSVPSVTFWCTSYLGIDLNIAWYVIEQDLPQLEEAILHLISLLPPER